LPSAPWSGWDGGRRDSPANAGIHVRANKTRNSTGARQIFTWLGENGDGTGRRAAWDACIAARPLGIEHCVFCTDEDECYVEENGRSQTNQ
jgi:hypothetical protein